MARQTSLTIYAPNDNAVLYEMTKIYEGCTEKFTLMQEDYIELKFTTTAAIHFPIGAWTYWNGKQYQVTEQQTPTYSQDSGGFEYTLKMEAYYRAWSQRIYKYQADDPKITGREATFSLTANLKEHVKLFVKLLNKEGYRYEPQDTSTGMIKAESKEFTYLITSSEADQIIDEDGNEVSNFDTLKTLTYQSTSYLDALTQISEEWETEWWVEDNVINFGKKEDTTTEPVDFILGKNVVSMDGSKSETDYATRVYAFGGTDNLPSNWNKGDPTFSLTLIGSSTSTEKQGYVDYWYTLSKSLYLKYFADAVKTESFEYASLGTCSYPGKTIKADKTAASCAFYTKEICKFPLGLSAGGYDGVCLSFEWTKLDCPHIMLRGDYNVLQALTANAYVVLTDDGTNNTTLNARGYYDSTDNSNFYSEAIIKNAVGWQRLFSGDAKLIRMDNPKQSLLDMGELRIDKSFTVGKTYTNGAIVIALSIFGKTGSAASHYLTAYLGRKGEDNSYPQPEGQKLFLSYGNYTRAATTLTNKSDAEYSREAYVRPSFPRRLSSTGESQFDIKSSCVLQIPVNDQDITTTDFSPIPTDKTVMLTGMVNSLLPSWYFPQNVSDKELITAMAETHLALPAPFYVDAQPDEDLAFKEIVEKILVFEDIYPRTKTAITDVQPQQRSVNEEDAQTQEENSGGQQTEVEMYTAYYVKQDAFEFSTDYLLQGGENLQIMFQDGPLTGLTFDCVYNLESAPTDIFNKGYFFIQRKRFEGGIYLPNQAQCPKEGNHFTLLGWDPTRLPDLGLIEKAQRELQYATQNEIKKMNIDPTTYECTLFSDVAYGREEATLISDEDGTTLTQDDDTARLLSKNDDRLSAGQALILPLGRRVRLYNGAYFKSGVRESRIMGWERCMDIPWDSPKYSVGEKAVYSRLSEIEKQLSGTQGAVNTATLAQIASAESAAQQTTGSGSSVYLIQTNDGTQPTDSNAYSAARANAEFLSSTTDQDTKAQITFRGGTVSYSSTPATADTAADGLIEYFEG